jgi:hypothetical protein
LAGEKQTEKTNWKSTAKDISIMLGIAFINGMRGAMGAHAYDSFIKGSRKEGKVVPLQKVV